MNSIQFFRTWPPLLSVLLWAAAAEAQLIPISTHLSQDQGKATPASVSRAQVSAFQRYNLTRRGREQEVLIVFCNTTDKCPGCPLALKPRREEYAPVSLQLRTEEGFTLRYRDGNEYKPLDNGASIAATSATFLKVRAGKRVSLGLHTLTGTLTYRFAQGTSSTQQIDVSIPLQVADHEARVVDTRWPFASQTSWGDRIKTAVLLPLIIPAGLIFMVACGVLNSCDL